MTERITVGRLYPTLPAPLQRNGGARPAAGRSEFDQLLQSELVKFSHHAETRLKQRGIQIDNEQLAKLENAIDKAAAKGAKDTLMVLGGTALIVNVPNRTVITALDGAKLQDQVFTQIDSAVIIS
ncbi:TIGR02530 family flagellar biosynthesis protein [Paenibacillus chitinolyticus]|uniref:TIGR02530 family flagellar biosynthesis protein n=1 Tax=Paenibacillus chitinolyticus TaxID=79263 RepID=UPI002DBC2D57|nr:TIGR02530 family flagellar biosynthesis protein [Paenibacillus chitinolyticus]MEC0244775.1 TIGR02530 family flagellar biosynthesis protein [Paenibacillus chitinolyticus]